MMWYVSSLIFASQAIIAQQEAAQRAQRRAHAAMRSAMAEPAPKVCQYCQQPGRGKLCKQCGAPKTVAAAVDYCTRCGGAHPLSRCKWPI